MLSIDFAYFISFLLFLFVAYRIGFHRAKSAFHTEVSKVKKHIDDAAQSKEMALLTLNELKHQLSEFEQQSDEHLQHLEVRGKEIAQQHSEQLEKLISERERHHTELLTQEMRLHLQSIKDELLDYVFEKLKGRLTHNQEARDRYHERAMEMIERSKESKAS